MADRSPLTDVLAAARTRVLSQLDLSPCNGCDACGLRCTAGVQMSRDEFDAVRAHMEDPANTANVARVMAQDKRVTVTEGVFVEACPFRDMEAGRCSIYPARPLVCRLLGHVEWLPCPIERIEHPARTEDGIALMRAYADVPRRTYEAWLELVQSQTPAPGAADTE